MKKTVVLCRCLVQVIKKKFFKNSKHDESQECEALKKMIMEGSSSEEKDHEEEYVYNYGLTTRWQTL